MNAIAHRSLKCAFAFLALAASPGCNFGPKQMEEGHLAYNEALRSSGDDELLLNIVRLRYLDTVEFLATSSISSQLSFTVALGAEGGDTTLLGRIATGRGEVSYSTRPTFTFIPQRGEEFSSRLVEPVHLDMLTDLVGADWDINLMFRLLVRSMNDRVNDIGLPDPVFNDIAARLGKLQAEAQLTVGYVKRKETLSDPIDSSRVSGTDLVEAAKAGFRFSEAADKGTFVLTSARLQPVLAISPKAGETDEIVRALRLAPGQPHYELHEGTLLGEPLDEYNDLTLRTRSLMGAPLYVAHGVQVPEEHTELGLTTAHWPAGSEHTRDFDDLFIVHSSEKQPEAERAVRYRDYWFYIDDADSTTRITFMLLAELFRLGLARETGQQAPVLTLPIGGF